MLNPCDISGAAEKLFDGNHCLECLEPFFNQFRLEVFVRIEAEVFDGDRAHGAAVEHAGSEAVFGIIAVAGQTTHETAGK